jgi:tetratricopeptide (TPR) repeat protein
MKIRMRMVIVRVAAGGLGLVAMCADLQAASARGPVALNVDAMPAPRPALRYTLGHEALDQIPGNAAIAYDRAIATISQSKEWAEDRGKCSEWLSASLDAFPGEAVADLLGRYQGSLEELVRASRHEQCDWQLPIRELGVHVQLPHLSNLRDAARLVALDARLRIKQQNHELALERLRVGMTLARHAGQGSTLVEGLVGLAIHGMMLDQLEALIQAPGAPNLYWALTDLPPASLNAWQSTRWERCFVYVHLPAFWEKRTQSVTAADLRQSIVGFQRISGRGFEKGILSEDEQASVMGAAAGVVLYPKARQSLIDQGRSAESIDTLPVAQVIADYIGGAYAQQRDNLFKWFALPYYQGRAGLDQAMKDLESGVAEDPAAHFISRMFLPALGRVAERFAQLDRRLAALRCVEAVRLHAASHEGRLPSVLGEIKEVPVPADPMSGQAFGYRQQGNSATLEAPLDLDQPAVLSAVYEITLRP